LGGEPAFLLERKIHRPIWPKTHKHNAQQENVVGCEKSNYFKRITFSHIPVVFGPTGSSAIQSADPENPTLEPNMKWIGRPVAEISPFEI